MIGTWTPPGNIFTVEFDDEALTLKLVKKTPIPEAEPISWMTFDVRLPFLFFSRILLTVAACKEKHLRRVHEEMVVARRQGARRHQP